MRQISSVVLLIALCGPAVAQSDGMPPEIGTAPDSAAIATLFPEGAPDLLAPESFTRTYRVPPSVVPVEPQKPSTAIKYSDGPVKYELGTKVTANSPAPTIVPQVPDPKVIGGAAGGAGEVNGRVAYGDGHWEVYGAQKFGVTQGDGTLPTTQEITTFGSSYQLPDWMAGGRIGASLELAPSMDEHKTRMEYRQKFGPAEGFIAAEQTFVPDWSDAKQAPTTVRGGVTRKF